MACKICKAGPYCSAAPNWCHTNHDREGRDGIWSHFSPLRISNVPPDFGANSWHNDRGNPEEKAEHRLKKLEWGHLKPVSHLLRAFVRISRMSLSFSFVGERLMGQQEQGQQRGQSASERVSERTSEREGCRGFQRFFEVFRGFQSFSEVFGGFQRFSEVFQRFFRGPLRDPLRSRFPSQRLSVLLPLFLLPLNLSPTSLGGSLAHFPHFLVWMNIRPA